MAAAVSLHEVHWAVIHVLLRAVLYLERLDDPAARRLLDEIEEAFTAMRAENVGAASLIEEVKGANVRSSD
ncbi:MAG: hypothetical protein H0T94_01655 [Acidimicrobiia bacterium]|nr:hypothetical protein [Acidimicrobiia bacterium]